MTVARAIEIADPNATPEASEAPDAPLDGFRIGVTSHRRSRDLIEALEYQCFEIPGRASKVVSDALRAEIAHGRVIRLKRGRYGPGEMPRCTEYRIHQRVLDLREEAAIIASQADNDAAFWDALLA